MDLFLNGLDVRVQIETGDTGVINLLVKVQRVSMDAVCVRVPSLVMLDIVK